MRTDLTPRFNELSDEVSRIYATRFTDQELKDILAFYKSPSGKKMLTEQTKVIEASMKFAQDWANQAFRRSDRQDARGTEEKRDTRCDRRIPRSLTRASSKAGC